MNNQFEGSASVGATHDLIPALVRLVPPHLKPIPEHLRRFVHGDAVFSKFFFVELIM